MTAIGIMGGTFNPVHIGHIEIAKAAYEQYHLDEVWFMPNHIPGYKNQNELIDGQMRLEMVTLAVKDYPYFKVSDFELQRTGNTYTAETMQLLSMEYPKVEFYFIIGADSLNYFDKWREPDKILSYTKILAAPRDDSSKAAMQQRMIQLHEQFGENHFYPIECSKIDCSSSKIRKYLSEHDVKDYSPKQLARLAEQLYLSPDVLQYIREHHLYNILEK